MVKQVGSEGFVGRNAFCGWMELLLLVRAGGVEELSRSVPGWLLSWP